MKSLKRAPQLRRRLAARKRSASAIRGVEALESRAMLAVNSFSVAGSWTSNGQTGTLSGALSVDTESGVINSLNLSRSGGNLSSATYSTNSIVSEGQSGSGPERSYSFTTSAQGSYELRMSWSLPTGSLKTYVGGALTSFSFTSPTLGMFVAGQSGSITNVNDAPTGISISTASVAENAAVGAIVGTLSTTDPDISDTFTYTLVPGFGSTDNASFTIAGGQLKTAAVFDFETKSSFSVRIRSTDSGGCSRNAPSRSL